jgi:hypothetical protein
MPAGEAFLFPGISDVVAATRRNMSARQQQYLVKTVDLIVEARPARDIRPRHSAFGRD